MKIKRTLIKNIIYPLIGIGVFLTIWAISAKIYNLQFIFPSPVSALKGIFKIFALSAFWKSLFYSIVRTLCALSISFFIALIVTLMSKALDIKKIFSPIITIINSLPTMAILILLLIWTNAVITPVIVAFLVVFPVIHSSFSISLDKTSGDLTDLAKIFGANRLQTVKYIYLPSLKGVMRENAVNGFSLGLKIVVSAEIMAYTANSIGIFMQSLRAEFEISLLLSTAIIICSICILTESLLLKK